MITVSKTSYTIRNTDSLILAEVAVDEHGKITIYTINSLNLDDFRVLIEDFDKIYQMS